MSTDVVVSFSSSGYVTLERQIDNLERKINSFGTRSNFASFDRQLGTAGQKGGAAFARNFSTATNNLKTGNVATRLFTGFGQTAGRAFSSSFSLATTGLAVGATAVAGAAIGAGAFTASAINDAAGQQENLGGLASLLGTTREQIPELNQELKALAVDQNLVVSFNDAAKATELLIRNGVEYQDILDGQLRSTILFQNATGAGFGLSADTITDFALQFGVASDETDTLVNKLVGVTQASKFTANDLRLLASQAGALSKLGVELDDLLLSATLGAESFASGSDLGTSLKNFYGTLTGNSEKAADAISDLGLEFFKSNGELKDLTDIRGELNRVFSGEAFTGTRTVQNSVDGVFLSDKKLVGRINSAKNELNEFTEGIRGSGVPVANLESTYASLTSELAAYEGQLKVLDSLEKDQAPPASITLTKKEIKARVSELKKESRAVEKDIDVIGKLNKEVAVYSDQLARLRSAGTRIEEFTNPGLTEEDVIKFSKLIFGTDSYRFALDLAATSAEDFATAQGKILGADAGKQAEERSRGLSKALTTLGDTYDQLKADFGAPFLGPLEEGVRTLTDVLGTAQPAIQSFAETIVSGFVAPKVEQFSSFVTELGPQLQAATAGQAFEIDLGSLISIRRDSESFNFDIGGLFTFTNDGEKSTYSIFDFVTITNEDATRTVDVGGFFTFTNDGEKKTYNLLDFVTIDSTAETDKRTIGTEDFFLTKLSDAKKTTFNFSDFFIVESSNTSDKKTITVGDLYTGVFEGPNTKQVLNFGDFFTVKTATTAEQRIVEVGDVWSLAWDTDGNIRQVISLTDAFEIITTTEEGKLTVNAGDIFTFEKDASGEGAAKRQIKIGDYFEVNFEGFFTESVKLGDYVTFENFEINVAETFKLVGKLTLAGIIGVTPLDELITVASFIWPKIPAPEWLETLASTLGLSSSDPEPSAAAAQAADARTDNSTSGFLGTGIGAVDDTARAAAAAADQVLLQSQFNNNPIQIPVEYVPSNTIEGGINPFGDSSFGAGQSPGLTINQPVEIPAVYTFPETIGENAGPFAEGYVFPATADPASIQSSITGAISAIEPLQPMAIADVTGVQFQTDQFTDTYSVTARATGVSWGKFTNNYAASATVTSLDKGDYSPSYTGTVTITTVIGDTGPGGGPGFAAENYRGTSYLTNEFTTIAEKGRELFRTPDGITGMANSPALARLPIGTRIWSNPDTERILRSVSAARATPSVSATVDYAQLASVALELANLADSPDIAVSVSNSHDVEMLVSRMESMRMARL